MNNSHKFKHHKLPEVNETLKIPQITHDVMERLLHDRHGMIFKKHLLPTYRIVYDR